MEERRIRAREQMVDQPVPIQSYVVERPIELELGVPQQRPEALIARLTDGLSPLTDVRAAWLALAHWAPDDSWSWFLVIRTRDGDRTNVDAALQEALAGYEFDMPLDVIIDQPDQQEDIGIVIVPPR